MTKLCTIECLAKMASAFVLALCCLAGAGCASLETKQARYDAAMADPLPAGQARVCFVRQSSMLGAIVTHYVMDGGSGIEFDSKVIEQGQISCSNVAETTRTTITVTAEGITTNKDVVDLRRSGFWVVNVTDEQRDMPPNTDRMCYVKYLVLPADVSDRELTSSPNSSISILRRKGDIIVPLYLVSFDAKSGLPSLASLTPVADATDAIKPNARYVGAVRSGGSVIYDRPAGDMRFKVVTPGGDEAFSPGFQVQAGKKYLVDYTYGITGVGFTLTERP